MLPLLDSGLRRNDALAKFLKFFLHRQVFISVRLAAYQASGGAYLKLDSGLSNQLIGNGGQAAGG